MLSPQSCSLLGHFGFHLGIVLGSNLRKFGAFGVTPGCKTHGHSAKLLGSLVEELSRFTVTLDL